MFDRLYYEKEVEDYYLGKMLLEKYKNIHKFVIENHNNIPELRERENKDFVLMKRYLILGIRKTQKFVKNEKVSDYLVPYTSSGCSAMCMYCYLVCHFNKCSYLRVFVNREELLNRVIEFSRKSDKDLVFELGSNSDLVLENMITGNLEWTIEEFGKEEKGYITFPTKFSNVDSLLNLKHNGRTIVRISVNPQYIISNVEFKTSSLLDRIEAINKLVSHDYKVGILIAPVILVDNWESLYKELIETLSNKLSAKAKKTIFFEVIFMTYSFIHNKINEEAFPKAIKLYNKDLMKSRGFGKYGYKNEIKEQGELFFKEQLNIYFPQNKIIYIC